jgi:biotin carboxylase
MNLAWTKVLSNQEPPKKNCSQLLNRDAQLAIQSFDPKRPTVIIVDGYSSGRLLAGPFRAAGYQLLHIHSHGKPTTASFAESFWPDTFEVDIRYHGNFSKLLAQLNGVNVQAVLPGADPGVLFADKLSHALHQVNPQIATNGIELGRKDKFLMNEVLRAAGLDVALQVKAKNPAEAMTWVSAHRLFEKGPKKIVIKPLDSSGSRGLFIVSNESELENAFRVLASGHSGTGHAHHEVLLQEYLEGTEYVVNTVGIDGAHKHTCLIRYKKRLTDDGLHQIYHYDRLLPFQGDVQDTIKAYNNKVLQALGIRFGAGHSEVMMVPGRGPVLIEMNVRMMGSSQPALTEYATGQSQVDKLILAVQEPEKFKALRDGYDLKREALIFTLGNLNHKRMLLNPDALAHIQKIPGVIKISFNYPLGRKDVVVKPTIDLPTSIADIWVSHESAEVIEAAIAELEALEKDGRLLLPPR